MRDKKKAVIDLAKMEREIVSKTILETQTLKFFFAQSEEIGNEIDYEEALLFIEGAEDMSERLRFLRRKLYNVQIRLKYQAEESQRVDKELKDFKRSKIKLENAAKKRSQKRKKIDAEKKEN